MKTILKNRLFLILLVAFLFRIIIAPITYHSDSIDYLNWGINLQMNGFNDFYFRDTADAGPPNYPPVFYYGLYSLKADNHEPWLVGECRHLRTLCGLV